MKYLDLSDDTARQVIVDQEHGQYLGHVTTVLLDDGKTILAAYPKGHGRGTIILKKSTDGGLTWSERLPIPATFATGMEVPTLFKATDANGKQRILLFSGLCPIRMAYSENEGKDWTQLAPIGDYCGIVAMSDMMPLKQKGKYLALFHDDGHSLYGGTHNERRSFYLYKGSNGERKVEGMLSLKDEQGNWSEPTLERFEGSHDESIVWDQGKLIFETTFGNIDRGTHFHVNKVISKDGGLTWSQPMTIARHEQAHLCEAGMVRSPDGNEIAVLMRENSRTLHSFVMFTDDEGETFSKPVQLPAALTGDRHTIKYLPDGRLIITFRCVCPSAHYNGDWVAWVGSYSDLKTGGEGDRIIRLKRNYPTNTFADCAYPGLEVLPNGTVVATTYGHWVPWVPQENYPYILSVRLGAKDFS